MANYSEAQFQMESQTTFMAYFGSMVSTINESMTEKPTESTILSTIPDTTTTSGPKCAVGYSQCDSRTANPCVTDNGICCTLDGTLLHCVCHGHYTGKFCHRRITGYSTGYEGAKLTAVVSALVGVLVIALFVAVVILQFKYYKNRKKRSQKDEEIRKSMRVKPEIRRKDDDDASTRLLRTQPGYSWRQSVKRSTYNPQKSNGQSMSISVPENLFEIGLAKECQKETIRTKSNDGGGGEGGGGEGGEKGGGEGAAGSERLRIDPTISSGPTVQLVQDQHPSTMTVQFDSNSVAIHL